MMRIDFPDKEYAGYIFDLDGTLVDSMSQHYEAWKNALRQAGLPVFDEDTYYSMGGRAAADIVAEMAEREGRVDIDPHAVAVSKRMFYFEELKKNPPHAIEPVVEFARKCYGKKPIAIATGSALPGAIATLTAVGLEDLFEIIVTPDDVVHGKPAPDIFLKAAEKMGVPAGECCVFEDADPGIEGAVKAGMAYVRVYGRGM